MNRKCIDKEVWSGRLSSSASSVPIVQESPSPWARAKMNSYTYEGQFPPPFLVKSPYRWSWSQFLWTTTFYLRIIIIIIKLLCATSCCCRMLLLLLLRMHCNITKIMLRWATIQYKRRGTDMKPDSWAYIYFAWRGWWSARRGIVVGILVSFFRWWNNSRNKGAGTSLWQWDPSVDIYVAQKRALLLGVCTLCWIKTKSESLTNNWGGISSSSSCSTSMFTYDDSTEVRCKDICV